MGACVQVVIPEVDEEPIECSDIIGTNCIQTKYYEFFNINEGDLLTTLLDRIVEKIQTLDGTVIKYSSLQTCLDDTAAGVAGVPSGKAYKDTLGYIRYKL